MRARHLLVHAMFEKGPYEKYIRKHIFFVRHLLVHAMFEKGPYEKYMLFRKFIRLTKHMFFEKVYMFFKKVYMFFEKVCMFFKKYICFLKKYVCFLKKYIFFEKAYIFFVRLLLVHRTCQWFPFSNVLYIPYNMLIHVSYPDTKITNRCHDYKTFHG